MNLVPNVEQAEELQQEFQDQYKIWRQAHEAAQPEFEIDNVLFEHDPDWRNRILSIQAAHDHKGITWKVAWGLWLLGAVSGSLWVLSRKIH